MPNTLTSPNMNIVVPVNLTDPTPDWGARIQTALYTTVDGHDHSSGKGLQITPAGLNMNADLTFTPVATAFNVVGLRSTRYGVQSAALALGSDVGCLYAVTGTVGGIAYAGDAFWNNAAGTAIPITKGGFLANPPALSDKNVATAYTQTASETFTSYHVSAAATPTFTLAQVSAVAAGRYFILIDYLGTSESNPIALTPNGTDKINNVNAAFSLSLAFGMWLITTDASTGWSVQPLGVNYLRASGLSFSAAATPLFNQAISTTGAGTNWTFTSQAAKVSSAANGADFIFNTGAGDGAGKPGKFRMQFGAVEGPDFLYWQGTRNTQAGVLQVVPWQINTADGSAHTVYTYAIPTNGMVGMLVKFTCRAVGATGNSATGFVVVSAFNNAGTVSAGVSSATTATTGLAVFSAISATPSGTNVLIQVTASGVSSTDWEGTIEVWGN